MDTMGAIVFPWPFELILQANIVIGNALAGYISLASLLRELSPVVIFKTCSTTVRAL